jgi:creatinine amidohydrolase
MRFTDPLKAGKAAEDEVRQQKWGTHADEIETSMILYMQPASVRMERAVADGERVRPGPLTRDPKRSGQHYSPSGVFGDATLATWQKGEKITEATVADILKDIDALAAVALPVGFSSSRRPQH